MKFETFLQDLAKLSAKAQQIADDHAGDRLDDLFIKGENGVLTPKVAKIKIGDEIVEIPRMALRNLNSLRIDELDMEFATEIDFSDEDVHVNLKDGLQQNAAKVDVKVKFVHDTVAEGGAILQEKMNNSITTQVFITPNTETEV